MPNNPKSALFGTFAVFSAKFRLFSFTAPPVQLTQTVEIYRENTTKLLEGNLISGSLRSIEKNERTKMHNNQLRI